MKTIKWLVLGTLGFAAGIILIVGLTFGGAKLSLEVKRMFGTELESIKTDIYQQNKGFVEGTVRELRTLRVDYEKATPSQQESLRSLILHRANELDWDRLPSDVREFLESIST